MKQIKLKAGLLPFTIAISLILSIICGALILALYYHNIIWLMHQRDIRFLNNIQSTKELILATGVQNYPIGEPVPLDLFGETKDSVLILHTKWGAFDLFTIEAFAGAENRKEAFLAAKETSLFPNATLYLADHDGIGLTLIGNTKIIGDAFLPRQGVQPGYLNHQSFLGSRLINGDTQQSSSSVPSLSEEFAKSYKQLSNLSRNESAIDYYEFDNASLANSFCGPTKYLFSEEPITLNKHLKGNIIVFSNSEIEITSSCRADNIIVVAPRVVVTSYFKGNLQIFAKESLIVQDHARLKYPSVLMCQNKEGSRIEIGKDATIEGGIYHLDSQKEEGGAMGNLMIDEAIIKGQVVTYGNVELHGSIYGQLICNKTIFTGRKGKVYTNYLVDCELNIEKIPKLYLFPPVLECPSAKYEILRNL